MNNRRKFGKCKNTCKLNNKGLTKQCSQEEITREIRKYFEMSEKQKFNNQNLWYTAKVMIREKFMVVSTYKKGRKILNQ